MGFIRIDKNNTDVGFKNICDVDWKLYMDMSESTIDGPMDIIAGKQGYDKDGNLIMGELVPEGYTVEEKEVSISENGDYEIRPDEANFLTKVNLTVDVPEGTDTSDATATAGDILKGKTAYVNGEKITGTFECGEVDKDKMLKEWTSDANARPEDILKGKTAYVNGNKIVGTYEPQECPECPDFKTEEKEITIHSNGTFYVNKSLLMDGMTKVKIIVDVTNPEPVPPTPSSEYEMIKITNGFNYQPAVGDYIYTRDNLRRWVDENVDISQLEGDADISGNGHILHTHMKYVNPDLPSINIITVPWTTKMNVNAVVNRDIYNMLGIKEDETDPHNELVYVNSVSSTYNWASARWTIFDENVDIFVFRKK